MLFSWRYPFSKALFVSVSSIFEYHSAPDHSSTLIAFICITSSSGICEHHNIPKPYRCVGPLTTVSLTRRWRLTAYFRRYFLIKSKKQTNCKLLLQGGAIRKIRKLNFPACWALTQSSYAWQAGTYRLFFLIKKLMPLIKMETTVPIQHRATPVEVTSISADQSSLATYCASIW